MTLSLAGDLAAALIGIAVPGSILGLAVYLGLLALWPAFRGWTLPAAQLLTRFLGALIVPAAVGLAAFAPFLAEVAPRLMLVIVVSTLVTGLTTALIFAGLRR
ncbi:MAG: CidA/LrgA family protein [Sphingomonadaceae bacterium]|nr:CidA/LrgA family protein [Sphingomonadaceae bacterium]